jgi:hypothetical protein
VQQRLVRRAGEHGSERAQRFDRNPRLLEVAAVAGLELGEAERGDGDERLREQVADPQLGDRLAELALLLRFGGVSPR